MLDLLWFGVHCTVHTHIHSGPEVFTVHSLHECQALRVHAMYGLTVNLLIYACERAEKNFVHFEKGSHFIWIFECARECMRLVCIIIIMMTETLLLLLLLLFSFLFTSLSLHLAFSKSMSVSTVIYKVHSPSTQ